MPIRRLILRIAVMATVSRRRHTMRIRRLMLLIVAATVLAACGSAAAQAPAAAQPTAALPSSSAPTAGTIPTAAPAATTFAGLASGLDNATQARIRIANGVMNAPQVDVYINGLPAFNAGKPQQNIDVGKFSGWLYVTPGTYMVALVPHGGAVKQALFAPIAVNAAAGHRYTIAAVGAKNITSLVLDETALVTGIDTKPTDTVLINMNNVLGIPAIDETLAGKAAATNIRFGTAQAYDCPIGRPHSITSVTGKPAVILGQGDNTCEPAISRIVMHYGVHPGADEGNDSQGTSELNTLDFLAEFNRYQVATDDGHVLTFKTLLAAIDAAGMHDQFANSGPYFFFAPTDEAFAALPKAQRDALLTDPQALSTLLKAHFIPSYYPFGNLFSVSATPELTNLLGHTFTMMEADNGNIVNGVPVMGTNYTVRNGNRVQPIDKFLPVK